MVRLGKRRAEHQRPTLENPVLLPPVLYGMCKTNLVVESKDGAIEMNLDGALEQIKTADELIKEPRLS